MQFYNDISLVPFYMLYAFGLFVVLGCSIILHELGHLFIFYINNIKAKIYFNKTGRYWQTGLEEDYDKLPDKAYKTLVWVGILLGLVPLLIAGLIYTPNFLMLLPYLVGCAPDIKNLNIKWEDEL